MHGPAACSDGAGSAVSAMGYLGDGRRANLGVDTWSIGEVLWLWSKGGAIFERLGPRSSLFPRGCGDE